MTALRAVPRAATIGRRLAPVLAALAALATARPATLGAQHGGPPPAAGGAAHAAPAAGAVQPPRAAGQLSGTIVNAAGQPVASASVAVRTLRDSALVGGALTQPDGAFAVEGLAPGHYRLDVRAIGFAPLRRTDIAIAADAPKVELGQVQLTAVAVQLSATTVTAEREQATLAPDRNSYVVKDMATASGGTAVDVLRTVPGVEVDGENRVSLRGNANVVVQINGRASPMRGEQLGNFLASLSSSVVQKVEVVANPSAKDDPEGLAGILNIVLKQQTDLGTSGGVTVGGGSTNQANASANVGHQQGPVTLFGTFDFFRDERAMTGWTTRTDRGNDETPHLLADHRGLMFPRSRNFTGQAEWKFQEKNTLSLNTLVSRWNFDRENSNAYRLLDADNALVDRYDRTGDVTMQQQTADATLSFRRTIQEQRHVTVAEVRALRWTGDVSSDQSFLPRELDGTPRADGRTRSREDQDDERTEYTAQVDVTRPLGERAKIETGVKSVLRGLDNGIVSAAYSFDDGVFTPTPHLDSRFDYRDQVHAAYAVLSRSAGKVTAQAGVRVEQAASEFDVTGEDETFENDYRSVYPSGLVSYDFSTTRQLKFSYSKRVQRPDTRQMNPASRPHEDQTQVFRGNPYLQPEYTHALEIGFQQSFDKGSVQVTPFYRRTVDAVRFVRFIDPDGVTVSTFANLAQSESWGTDASGSYRLGKLNGFAGISAFRVVSDASNLERDVSAESFGWSARTNATYRLRPSLEASAFAFYRAPQTMEFGKMRAHTMLTLSLRQKINGDKGSVTLRIQDPLKTMNFGQTQVDGLVEQSTLREFAARGAFLSFSYNFGRAPRLRPRPTDQAPDPGMQQ